MEIDIQPGDLRTPIDIYTKSLTGSGGFKTEAYTKSFSAKCKWVNDHYQSGFEKKTSGANQVEKQATVTMRYHASVTETCRIVMSGLTYEIINGIDNVRQRNRWIQFKVRAVING